MNALQQFAYAGQTIRTEQSTTSFEAEDPRMITEADLAAAWESGYWHGTSHEGPLNDAAVAAKNPHRAKGVTPAKACRVGRKTGQLSEDQR